MRYRNPKKESDLFSMIEHQQSVLKAVKGINKLNAAIDWELFRGELESILGYENRDPKRGGRPPFDAVLMLKVLVLQKYYGPGNTTDSATSFTTWTVMPSCAAERPKRPQKRPYGQNRNTTAVKIPAQVEYTYPIYRN